MDQILALFYLVTCAVLVARMFVGKSVLDCHLGVIGAFSIGYYPLPVFFKSLSSLDYYSEDTVFSALLIHWLFLVFLILGAAVGRRIFITRNPLKLALVDGLLHNYRIPLSAIAFAVYVVYFSTQRLTSYSADDFEAYFNDRGPFFAIIAAFGNMSLAYLAVSLAASWKVADRFGLLVIGGMFLTCVCLTLTLGQRLIIISPIFILLASLYASGQRKRAIRLLGAGVLMLLIISPVAVYIRQSQHERSGGGGNVIQGFQYEGGFLESSFRSIVDRSDLIYVTIAMKRYIDIAPAPGPIYYLSVLLIPVPKVLIGEKPYLLSVDGTPTGELSIWAWRVLQGNTGSLTAFGGLYAYREGGWLWLGINGLATGMFFAFLARWLGGGGTVGRFFYALLFVALSVQKVPTSFFEALAAFMGVLPFIVFVYLMSKLWQWFAPKKIRPSRRKPRPFGESDLDPRPASAS
jgi:hypothetical protein